MKKITCEICPIRNTNCIADLPAEKLDEFRSFSVSIAYRSRQVLFHEGTVASGLYLVCHGSIKLYQSGRLGREHILAVAAPGEVLGELPLDPSDHYSASAEALVDSQVCYLSREHLSHFIETHPALAVRLIAALSDSLIAARCRVRDLALKSAETRLAELLLNLTSHDGLPRDGTRQIVLSFSRRELAEMIGVSTETAIRLLAKLRAKGVIETNGRDLAVTDFNKLGNLARLPF